MDKTNLYIIYILVSFVLTVGVSVWLTKRAKPEKRLYWFAGCSVVTFIWLGLIQAPIAIISAVVLLALLKNENDKPLADIASGLSLVFSSVLGVGLFGSYILGSIGGIYWLWLAIQLKSFSMFLVGMFPLSWLVTAPVGAYSLIFGTPAWVLKWFS